MNKRLLGLAVAGSMILGLSTANAGVPSTVQSTASGPTTATQILITPAGLGDILGGVPGGTVTVTVRDADGNPIAGYPFQDMTLDDIGNGDLNICPGGSVADANTNASGVSTFTGAIAGGGFSQAGVQVYLGGNPLAGAALPFEVNSPDITGDRVVNVQDLGQFSTDFGSNTFKSDFSGDGVVNLSDVGIFSVAFLEVCP